MNREAAALGVPVYTTYGGRLGGVDEELIREDGCARSPTRARSSCRSATDATTARERRDPQVMLDLLLSALLESATSSSTSAP